MKLPFTINGETKYFHSKEQLKKIHDFQTSSPVCTEEYIRKEKKKEEEEKTKITRTPIKINHRAGKAIKQRAKTGNQQQEINMNKTNQYISVININANGPNSPVKRNRSAKLSKQDDPVIWHSRNML